MSFLNRLNPGRSLFFRVFLWFWVGAILIFVSSFWLVKQFDSEVRYLPIRPSQAKTLNTVARKLQKQIDKRSDEVELEKLLSQAGKRNRLGLLLVEPKSQSVIYGFARNRRPGEKILRDFNQQDSPITIDVGSGVFIGPGSVNFKQKEYLLFVSYARPGGMIRSIREQHPGLFLSFLILSSGALCYLFVRSLLNPILQLQSASKKMAAGDLRARVGSASHRLDEIGQLGRDFNVMSEQVEDLMASQKRLLADISHELRSPLARLQLSIGIARQTDDASNPDNIKIALERIEKEALQIEQMISQILTLSRVDNQQPLENLQQVTVAQLMQPIVTDGQFEAEQRGKQLHYQCQEDGLIKVEPQLLSSAIENVLRNAISYAKHEINMTVTKGDEQIEWRVTDDGNGIEAAQLSRIFEPFFRESLARDRHSGGVGLGLAIARHGIRKHSGNITATNREKGGLEVVITIPLR